MAETMNLIDYLKNKQHVYEELLIANKDNFDEKGILHIQTELGILEKLLRELYRSEFRNNVISWLTKKVSDEPENFMVTINEQIEKDIENAMEATEKVVNEGSADESAEVSLEEDIVPDDIPDAPPVMEEPKAEPLQEDYHQYYVPYKFDFTNEWKNLPNEERKDIIDRIKSLKLSKEEVNTIKTLAENPEFVLEKLMENKGEQAVIIQASIDSLIDKGLVIETGNFNNLVFLTKIGVWCYALSQKEAPIIYQEKASGIFTWQMQE